MELGRTWGEKNVQRYLVRDNFVRLAIAAALLGAAVYYQASCGFRLGEAAGARADSVMAIAIMLASVILLSSVARRRKFLAGGVAFAATFVLWGMSVRYSTSLDIRYGGAYGWAGERIAVITWIGGPVLSAISSMLVVAIGSIPKWRPFARP